MSSISQLQKQKAELCCFSKANSKHMGLKRFGPSFSASLSTAKRCPYPSDWELLGQTQVTESHSTPRDMHFSQSRCSYLKVKTLQIHSWKSYYLDKAWLAEDWGWTRKSWARGGEGEMEVGRTMCGHWLQKGLPKSCSVSIWKVKRNGKVNVGSRQVLGYKSTKNPASPCSSVSLCKSRWVCLKPWRTVLRLQVSSKE